jgi:hypothetical protein
MALSCVCYVYNDPRPGRLRPNKLMLETISFSALMSCLGPFFFICKLPRHPLLSAPSRALGPRSERDEDMTWEDIFSRAAPSFPGGASVFSPPP